MATSKQYISRNPRTLLEHAASGFLASPPDAPFPTPSCWLVLRQGGLRDDLLSLAARRGVPGWFDPPLALIQELPDLLAAWERPAITDFARLVLVGRALRESAGSAFGSIRDIDAYADEVDRWIGEMIGAGVSPEAARAALLRGPRTDAFARTRDDELVRAYARYLELLGEAELRDPRARLRECAAAVRARPDVVRERLGGRRELRLVGLSDPRGGWSELLAALLDCPALDHVALYTAEPLPFIAALGVESVDLDALPHFTAALFDESAQRSVSAAPHITLLSAPDLTREAEEIAVRVRALADAGTPLHRIAVIVRSARPYSGQIMRALSRAGVPASARVRYALREVPAVRALLALFDVAASGWERHGLVELAETPFFRARLDAGVLNFIGYQRRISGLSGWRVAHERLLAAAQAREQRIAANPDDEEALRMRTPPADRVARAQSDFDAFASLAASLDSPRTLQKWLAWLTEFLDADGWKLQHALYRAPGERHDAVRIDTVAWKAMRGVVDDWRAAEERWGSTESIPVRGFAERLRGMLSGDAALFTPVRRGVQVLEGLAASFRSFDHVFIAGLDAARVPLRAPHSPLLDEHDRQALREAGLAIDTREDWEQRERSLFLNMLSTAGETLTLSCSRYDESGAEQLPSAFYEEVAFARDLTPLEIAGSRAFTPGLPLAADPAAVNRAIAAAHAEQGRAAAAATAHNGRISDPGMLAWLAAELGETRVWSPTQLEAFAKCPWSYLSGRLMRLEKLEDPDLDIDALTRGAILHDALHRFYTAARARVGGPVNLRTTDLGWARPVAAESITAAIDHARGSVWVGHPALEQQKLAELSRQLVAFIEWEAEENDKADRRNTNAGKWVRTDVDEHEVAFEDVALEIDGLTIRFRGFIDRVEVANDARGGADHMVAAVDYKSSIYSTPASGESRGWEDGVVLQVPLYAYALTQIRPGTEPARVEYRTIRNRKRAHTLALYKYDRFGLSADEKAQEKYDSALHHVARHVRSARAGEFPPDPPPSCTCPPFCHARDICRIPGGPRSLR